MIINGFKHLEIKILRKPKFASSFIINRPVRFDPGLGRFPELDLLVIGEEGVPFTATLVEGTEDFQGVAILDDDLPFLERGESVATVAFDGGNLGDKGEGFLGGPVGSYLKRTSINSNL